MALTRFFEPQLLNRSVSSSSSAITCWLKSLNSKYNDIELLSNQKNSVGRSRDTQIADTFCSKSQLIVEVFPEEHYVQILVKGSNASGLNGFLLEQGTMTKGYHDDNLEILYGRYRYKIEFIPPPSKKFKKETVQSNSEKRTNDEVEPSILEESKVNDDDGVWTSIENDKLVIFTSCNTKSSNKIAGYDLDWTIIKTKSGNVFPKDMNDWEIMYPEVPGKLKSLYENGYKICFFTNQGAIGNGKCKLSDFKFRIKSILRKFRIPIQVFISTTNSIYRKPITGMWDYLGNHMNDGITISLNHSFYVGDAAGRPETKLPIKRKRDHSCVDRLFAMNIGGGILFYTPEEHFQNKSKSVDWIRPEFNPNEIQHLKLFEPENCKIKIPSDRTEIILMVGLPGSGKSFFVEHHLKKFGYVVLNADTIGSVQKCVSACEENINVKKKSCVIDNTNIDVETRKKFVIIGQKSAVPVRCFVMNTSYAHIKHNLAFRNLIDQKHSKINDMILNSIKKKLILPDLKEGYTEIVKVNAAVIDKFQNESEKKLYQMFL